MTPSPLSVWTFDPEPYEFPAPRWPMLASLTVASLGQSGRDYAFVDAGKPTLQFALGRYALTRALALCGVGPGTGAMLPAYHCESMLDPVMALGGEAVFYPVTPALEPDADAIESVLRSNRSIRALIAVHYFGFPFDFGEVAARLRQYGVSLIEDCCHAFVVDRRDGVIGAWGRFLVSSPYKLLPCCEGGILAANGTAESLGDHQGRFGLRTELAACSYLLGQTLLRSRRRPPLVQYDRGKGTRVEQSWHARSRDGLSAHYDPARSELRRSKVSEMLQRLCSPDKIARRRRRIYQLWLDALHGVPNAKPWAPRLPPGAVPYVFPLLLERPQRDFAAIKYCGIPVWRWDTLAVTSCATSSAYRFKLLQLPCHQSLGEKDVEEMAALLRSVLKD